MHTRTRARAHTQGESRNRMRRMRAQNHRLWKENLKLHIFLCEVRFGLLCLDQESVSVADARATKNGCVSRVNAARHPREVGARLGGQVRNNWQEPVNPGAGIKILSSSCLVFNVKIFFLLQIASVMNCIYSLKSENWWSRGNKEKINRTWSCSQGLCFDSQSYPKWLYAAGNFDTCVVSFPGFTRQSSPWTPVCTALFERLNYDSHVPVPFEPFLLMFLPHLRHLTTFLIPSVLDPATGSQVRLIGNPLGRKYRTPLVQTPQTRTACLSHIFWMKRVFSRCEGVPCPFNKFSPSLQSSVVIKPKAEHRWQLWHSISSHVLSPEVNTKRLWL